MENEVTFGFEHALELIKNGSAVARKGWNNPYIKVKAQYPDANSKMTKPYLYMEKLYPSLNVTDVFPLDLSCESIFAEDWYLIID